jgi:hypothetical protein
MADQNSESDEFQFDVRQSMIEGLVLDRSTHAWVAHEFIGPILTVLRRLPTKDIEALNEREFLFVAPPPNFLGLVFAWPRSIKVGQKIVYFSPILLSLPPEEIYATVAHELAHVLLDHDDAPSARAREIAEEGDRQADDFVKAWGFAIPSSWNRY